MKKIWIGKKIELFIRSAYNKREKTGRTDRKTEMFSVCLFTVQILPYFYIREKKHDDTENRMEPDRVV